MAGFQDIIGQEQIKEHLRNALSSGKVSHAYIINGEKSSGKEFIAKVFVIPVSRRCPAITRILSMCVMKSPIPSVWMTFAPR